MAPEYSVEKLLALDKTGLVEFIKANLDAQEAIDITNIKDWDEVSESKQTELLQWLIEAYPIAKGPQLSGFFQDLLAKLEGIHSRRKALRESPSTSPEPRLVSLSPQPGAVKEHQIRCYQTLVNDGGRPPCSLETLHKIYQSPTDFIELLRPWLENPASQDPDDLGVFSRPLARWKEFRGWQCDNRGRIAITADESLAAFREEKQRYFESAGLASITTAPDFEDTIRKMWQQEQNTGRLEWVREVKDGSFTEYVKAARRRLTEHGFHEAFQLLKDPRRQDARVTWIEYLEFECWWLDANTKTVQRHKPSHDAAWEELVRSGVLRAGETEEELSTPSTSVPDQQSTLRDEAIRRFMRQTKAYRDAKTVESRQSLRVQWALSQMPEKPATHKPAARKPAARTGKRRLEEDEETLDEALEQRPAAKKQRTEPGRKQDIGASRRNKTTATRRRNTSRTSGLLSLAGQSWELEDGKRRSTRTKDAKERGKGVDKPLGTLREVL
ncbi:hypothetical protein G6O67_008771 [Ophiocordyceps sinensis]|uniref:Ankyrin 2,3/unc44 n=1 Tax=Ophiocordyceps sinensis TaxID=72228 RepID=A0A8H4PML0_9HYPO|nr:hypothetical protein G6O67_008771 [Ophiocordyceps sinensis]